MNVKNNVLIKITKDEIINEILNIPEYIQVIGSYAVHNLNMKRIKFSTNLIIIEDFAFLNSEDLEEITIPDSVIRIGERAFANAKKLKKLTLPEGLTNLGRGAFSGCENLEEVVLPSSLKKINSRTFANCKNLKKIIIPEGVEEIDWGAFAGCENLEEIVLPSTLKKLGKEAFMNCKKLKKINIPKQIDTLPNSLFKGCKELNIPLPDHIKTLEDSVFEGCSRLTYFPKHVVSFGKNCFKYCKSLKEITINPEVTEFPNSMFEGCTNLFKINHTQNQKVTIGKRCFKNCKSLPSIPEIVQNFNEEAFKNCINIKAINIIDKVIPFACFQGCKNLEIIQGDETIEVLKSFAFSNCQKLRQINLENCIKISSEALSHCLLLEKVRLSHNLKEIGTMAFYNCISLTDINIPDALESIKKKAFQKCISLKTFRIPANLNTLGIAALNYMDSLERIEVSPENEKFLTPDNKILIKRMEGELVLYAGGLKQKSYSLYDYCVDTTQNIETIQPLNSIGAYAFTGNPYLEELTICSCTNSLDITSFKGCPNLKKLILKQIPLHTSHGFELKDNNRFYMEKFSKNTPFLPFEEVEYQGNFTLINHNALPHFTNVTKIILPENTTPCAIGNFAFKECGIKSIRVPNNITRFEKETFKENVSVNFDNGFSLITPLEYSINNNYYGNYRLYTLPEKYYIEETKKEESVITTLTKKQIRRVCRYPEVIENNPIAFLDIMNELINRNLDTPLLTNGILMKNIDLKDREILFSYLEQEKAFAFQILRKSKLLEEDDSLIQGLLQNEHAKSIIKFIELLKKYQKEDNFLTNKMFIYIMDNPNAEDFFKYFDTNMKHLINKSQIKENPSTIKENLNDLLTLLKITGALEEDPITRQKAMMFIIEKIFAEKLPNGEKNEDQIVKDKIHTIFDYSLIPNIIFDKDFSEFFMKNYHELMKLEKRKAGTIKRIYSNFQEIKKTSTSNKGEQRKLKVTIEKCINYLNTKKFDNITKENRELAILVGSWFDSNETWNYAQAVYKESLTAPRNIFAKKTQNENGEEIFDNNPKDDLKGTVECGYSYEWLPKQDYINLVLGKYCGCCAHLEGAGFGIMRASMIDKNSQNLALKMENGEIVAKATIYVNRSEQYAVFNTIEVSLGHREKEQLQNLRETFIEGTKAFLIAYNENNPEKMLKNIYVGTKRNTVFEGWDNKEYPETNVHTSLDYSTYSLSGRGFHKGDWMIGQRLVLSKKPEKIILKRK